MKSLPARIGTHCCLSSLIERRTDRYVRLENTPVSKMFNVSEFNETFFANNSDKGLHPMIYARSSLNFSPCIGFVKKSASIRLVGMNLKTGRL